MNNFKIILNIIFATLFFQLSSCGLKVVENHGQVYEKNIDFEELIIGKSTKNPVYIGKINEKNKGKLARRL